MPRVKQRETVAGFNGPLSWPPTWPGLNGLCLVLSAVTATLSISANQMAFGLAIATFLVLWLRGHAPVHTGLEWPAALMIGWALLLVAFSTDTTQSIVYTRRWLLLAPLWLMASGARDDRLRGWILGALVAGVTVIVLIGYVQLVREGLGFYHEKSGILYGRLRLAQGYMTAGGLVMETSLVTLAFLTVLRKRRVRLLLAIALVLQLVALVLTLTRSSWLGFAAGAMVILSLRRPRWLPVFVLLLAVSIPLLPPVAKQRLRSTFDLFDAHNNQRLIMWRTGVQMIGDEPVTGFGDVDLREIYAGYHQDTPEGEKVELSGHLHNNLLMFGVLWGVPGLVLCVAFLVLLLRRLWQRWGEVRGRPPNGPEAAARDFDVGESARDPANGRDPASVQDLANAQDPAQACDLAHVQARHQGPARHLAQGWVLAALGVWVGFCVAGLFEWNFGDAEILTLMMLVCGMALAPSRSRA